MIIQQLYYQATDPFHSPSFQLWIDFNTYKSQSREVLKKHGNSIYNKQRVADGGLFHIVKLQSWFSEKKARYWVVDEAKEREQKRQASRAITRDVGEESDDSDDSNDDSEKSESDQDDIEDRIV